MKEILLVGLGGFIGCVARFKLTVWVLQHTPDWRFPAGTLLVNLIGCFAVGAVSGWALKQGFVAQHTRIFLIPGILGGFTTFSAFGYETFAMLRRGEPLVAVSYVLTSVVCGLVLVWLGFKLCAGGSAIN